MSAASKVKATDDQMEMLKVIFTVSDVERDAENDPEHSVGRQCAMRIMDALHDAGFKVVRF